MAKLWATWANIVFYCSSAGYPWATFVCSPVVAHRKDLEASRFFVSKFSLLKFLRLQLHGAIYRSDSFVLMPRYCANLKAIRYESTSLNRIVADKSHRVIVA